MSVLKALPNRGKFNQDYFLAEVLLSLSRQRRPNRRKNATFDFVVYKGNSMYHNAQKIAEEFRLNKIQ
jgi:hypothetical protein